MLDRKKRRKVALFVLYTFLLTYINQINVLAADADDVLFSPEQESVSDGDAIAFPEWEPDDPLLNPDVLARSSEEDDPGFAGGLLGGQYGTGSEETAHGNGSDEGIVFADQETLQEEVDRFLPNKGGIAPAERDSGLELNVEWSEGDYGGGFSARAIVNQARAWLGFNEADGSHRLIVDIYNSHYPLARNYRVTYGDSWCATFVSACAITTGLTDVIPTECGCEKMIDLFRNKGIWVENDAYVPKQGDIIFYDWNDSGIGDNTGWSDHVGIVEYCDGEKITVIEGNKNDAVERRVIGVNARYIRGFGVPNYPRH